ncbi:hypothetical protein PHET_09968 [Paragonimus heterotremus]|uniref:Uncharacterized protein n=1 Tax=Paragonimus heterotremus TaxID=100268 RepID=A0A8J4SV41_9TREM|nr:hypothetical protein PHET_09968 [Paragonimus heterotremus]
MKNQGASFYFGQPRKISSSYSRIFSKSNCPTVFLFLFLTVQCV